MLNGLCEGVRVMSVELETRAIPDFVQCMRAGVIGSMRELHVLFVQGTPPGVADAALRSVTEGNPRSPVAALFPERQAHDIHRSSLDYSRASRGCRGTPARGEATG
jgi:hypothetical protein